MAMTPFLRQTWAVSAVLLNMTVQGMLISYPSSLLPALKAPDSEIPVDLHTASLIASCIGTAGIPGLFLSSFVMDAGGRKMAHAIILVPGVVGWALVYFASNVTVLLTARILGGISAGGSVALGAMIIGEYSSPENRGMFLNLKTAAVCLGSMIVHILGHFLHWRTIALICTVPSIVAIIMTFTWPESPAYLAYKKRFQLSEDSFFMLREKNENSIREFNDMVDAQMNQKRGNTSISQSVIGFLRKFTRKDFLKPTLVVFVGSILLEVCGRHIFPAYALDIIGAVTGNKSQSFYYTLALDVIITASATFSSVLVRMMKRRTLLFSTGLLALVVLGAVCSYLFLVSLGMISGDNTWIPISLFVVYFILVNFGCTPIPLALLGEVFPLAHKATGAIVAGIILSICLSLGLAVTPFLLEALSIHGTFTIFGVSMAVTLLVFYYILPETKDRTLQEIEDFFNFGAFKNDEEKYVEEAQMKMLNFNSEDITVKNDTS